MVRVSVCAEPAWVGFLRISLQSNAAVSHRPLLFIYKVGPNDLIVKYHELAVRG